MIPLAICIGFFLGAVGMHAYEEGHGCVAAACSFVAIMVVLLGAFI